MKLFPFNLRARLQTGIMHSCSNALIWNALESSAPKLENVLIGDIRVSPRGITHCLLLVGLCISNLVALGSSEAGNRWATHEEYACALYKQVEAGNPKSERDLAALCSWIQKYPLDDVTYMALAGTAHNWYLEAENYRQLKKRVKFGTAAGQNASRELLLLAYIVEHLRRLPLDKEHKSERAALRRERARLMTSLATSVASTSHSALFEVLLLKSAISDHMDRFLDDEGITVSDIVNRINEQVDSYHAKVKEKVAFAWGEDQKSFVFCQANNRMFLRWEKHEKRGEKAPSPREVLARQLALVLQGPDRRTSCPGALNLTVSSKLNLLAWDRTFNPDDAQALGERILKEHANLTSATLARVREITAGSYFRMAKFAEARTHFAEALKLDPQSPHARNGVKLLSLPKYQDGQTSYTRGQRLPM